jgi:general secretion pathway protein G
MKRAFTMIELIFIIVIIGILAAVAFPRLAATSDDAKGAKVVHDLSVCIMDAGTYYMKNGTFGGKTQAGGAQTPSCVAADECFNFTENDSNGSLTVQKDTSVTSAKCREAQRIADENVLATTHVIHF